MKSLLIDISKLSYPRLLEDICTDLKDGKVVAMATDTVFGLVASAKHCGALGAVTAIKQRDQSISMPVLIGELSQFQLLCKQNLEQLQINDDALWEFWPGPLTVVVELRKGALCDRYFQSGTVGIRLPNDQRLRDIANHIGPIVATSANLHGLPTPSSGREVLQQLGPNSLSLGLSMVLDEESRSEVASTVVDISGSEHRVVRIGKISASALSGAFRINVGN